jgi:NAD(P)-dependent dehydrogenase (short-subunit alcohol dehydrogenase family)
LTALFIAGKMQSMKRVVLITDAETELGEELVRLYLNNGYAVAAATGEGKSRAGAEGLFYVEWKRRSALSTRNLMLRVLTRFDTLDEAILLASPSLDRTLLQEVASRTIDAALDDWLKGALFLSREVLELFRKRGEGRLSLVNYAQTGPLFPPLEAVLRGGFQSLAASLFASQSGRGVIISGFESYATRIPDFAAFIVSTWENRAEKTSGKWFRFPPGARLFSRGGALRRGDR